MTLTSAELIERHAELWAAATTHAFLDGAREGSLEEETFNRWLVQDRHFVIGLTRAWGHLLSAAPSTDFQLIADGIGAFTAELDWFEQLASERRLRLDGEPISETAAYIGYLEAMAGAPYPVATAAMWAVEVAYLHAWRGALGGSATYAAIAEHWANDEFAGFVERLGIVVDRELQAEPAHRSAAEEAFVSVLEQEASFWALGRSLNTDSTRAKPA